MSTEQFKIVSTRITQSKVPRGGVSGWMGGSERLGPVISLDTQVWEKWRPSTFMLLENILYGLAASISGPWLSRVCYCIRFHSLHFIPLRLSGCVRVFQRRDRTRRADLLQLLGGTNELNKKEIQIRQIKACSHIVLTFQCWSPQLVRLCGPSTWNTT